MYIVRYDTLSKAIDPKRRSVKLSDPNLWKAASPEGTWEPGHEIRSEALGISLFSKGTDEKLHYHELTWEIYQVLEGSLKIAVKPFRKAPWELVQLEIHDMIIFTPGTLHLVGSKCEHTTQVIQAPPALSDQVVLSVDKEDDKKEIDAANATLAQASRGRSLTSDDSPTIKRVV